jgi:hypothetical protein
MLKEEAKTIDASKNRTAISIITDDRELLRHGICRVKIPDRLDADLWARELSQVTPMSLGFEGDGEYAFYRNIMDEPDFPFDCLLNEESEIGRSILRHFPIRQLSEIRLDDAFCVHYNMDQDDTTGKKHTDPSDITVNICLQKSGDTEGSHVLFYGTRKLLNVQDHRQDPSGTSQIEETLLERFLVQQEPGYATIHYGDHAHETTALLKGSRTNIVATYWYTDTSKSDVATRTCY